MAQNFLIETNELQAELNELLKTQGLHLVCGRRVAADGDCFFDSVLALLEIPTILYIS